MNRVTVAPTWPESWRFSYSFDLEEIYGEIRNRGYAYAYANRKAMTLQLLSEAVPRGASVLDIAAGQGNFSLLLAEEGYDVTWNDLREELIGYVQLKHERGTLRFAPGNAFELTFPQLFDAILITEVIEHVAHPDQFLEKVAGLVKPGGVVIMTTPNGAYFRSTLPKFSDCKDPSLFESVQFKPDSDGHIFLLHLDELPKLSGGAGLSIEKVALFTNPLTNGHMKTEFFLRRLPSAWVRLVERLSQRLPEVLGERLLIQMAVRFRKTAGSIDAATAPLIR
jgi:2-polyprenyl-3-methyl-5-hydroxy-6-metoxy-1,4-benzoquinol methylase